MATLQQTYIQRFVAWRSQRITDRTFTYILAGVIGVFAAFAGYVLHLLIHFIEHLLTSDFDVEAHNWLYLVFPIVGIAITSAFVRLVVKDSISHGITRVLYAISSKQSYIKPHNTWTSVVASSITIGFGGSVGAEAPIVLTGSAIGSNLGRIFGMDRKTLMVLVGCGASAAVAGIYNAPIAGLVFTLEVLLIDMSMASIMPILISSVTAACLGYVLGGGTSMFTYESDAVWTLDKVPAYMLLGVFCGLVSLYFIKAMDACEAMYGKMKHPLHKLIVGGIILSTLIFLFPSLYGEGFSSINVFLAGSNEEEWGDLMSGSFFSQNAHLLLIYVALVIVFKAFATASTNGAGGCGGTFAPSLFVGGFSGFLFSHFWNVYNVGTGLSERNFTMLGMAGVMAGVMHAPLTGIFLIAELTGGYSMFIPLIIVSVMAVLTISLFERHSIYAIRLARQGQLLTHHTDRSVLTLMNLESVVEHNYVAVQPDMPLGKFIGTLGNAQLGFFPVVDTAGVLIGEVDITKSHHILFRTELYSKFNVAQVMSPVRVTVGNTDPMSDVMAKLDQTDSQYIGVVDVNNVLVGSISKTRVYSLYRKMVADYSTE